MIGLRLSEGFGKMNMTERNSRRKVILIESRMASLWLVSTNSLSGEPRKLFRGLFHVIFTFLPVVVQIPLLGLWTRLL